MTRALLAVLAVGIAASLAASAGHGAAARAQDTRARGVAPPRLDTAVVDSIAFGGSDNGEAFRHVAAAGAGFARLILDWSVVAPRGAQRPAGFSPRDPGDPAYRWEGFDGQVRQAVAAGLQPIVDIVGAPEWAQRANPTARRQDGPFWPSHVALGDFAEATATRYSGSYGGLPRVRHWQVWNEPNFSYYLTPQSVDARLVSPGWYRAMVNAFSASVHGVRPDNVVIAGGLAPYGAKTDSLDGTAPMVFLRQLLCLGPGTTPRKTCPYRTSFDVWSHHPYTSGGPTRSAGNPDDVSIGDLGEVRELLTAAEANGSIRSSRPVRFWVTEFSWDTSPPDPKGLPMWLHARWTSEALYRMWQQGVDLVTWFLIRDEPFPKVSTQSGLYFRGDGGVETDRPKLSLQAFRFPFVAFRTGKGRIEVWGRTPSGRPGAVLIEQSTASGVWRTLRRIPSRATGIFAATVADDGARGKLRARALGETSVPFGLRVPPDRDLCPFGTC